MKNVCLAMVCTLGLVACGGENRPAQDPSMSSTTSANAAASSDFKSSQADWATANPANAETSHALPSTSGETRAMAPTPTTTGAAPAGDGAAKGTAPVVNNPGVADGTKDANNTKINDRDRHGAVTPMDQGGGNDRDITAAIRRSVVADGALSFTAKNVKIIVSGGKVTLRGPVKSDAERSSIESKAKSTSGVSEVDNQLEVKK